MSNTHNQHQRYRDSAYQISRGWMIQSQLERDAQSGDEEAQLALADKCFNSNNGPEAFRWYQRAADEHNSVEAMLNLGVQYEHGVSGCPLDVSQGCYWFEKAVTAYEAQTSNVDAAAAAAATQQHTLPELKAITNVMLRMGQYWLGALSNARDSQGQQSALPQTDASKAVQWLEKAANLGCTESMAFLGNQYLSAFPQNVQKGMHWLRQAADQGLDGHAAYQMTVMYMSGLIPVDEEERDKWAEIAFMLGSKEVELVQPLMRRRRLSRRQCRERMAEIEQDQDMTDDLKQMNLNGVAPYVKCNREACRNMEQKGKPRFLKCAQCQKVKYCCKNCQVKDWKNCHKQACNQLKEAAEFSTRLLAKVSRKCSNPACQKFEQEEQQQGDGQSATFKKCTVCKQVKYCSRDCQKHHWLNGHKAQCMQVVD